MILITNENFHKRQITTSNNHNDINGNHKKDKKNDNDNDNFENTSCQLKFCIKK